MKNGIAPSENSANKIATQAGVTVEERASKNKEAWRLLVTRENWPAMAIFAVLTAVTLAGWIVVSQLVKHSLPGLEITLARNLSLGMLVMVMSFNILIFFLMSFVTQQRNRVAHLKRTIDKQISQQFNELKLSTERFELAIHGANDGLWDKNITLGTVYFSPRWKLMLGYNENEFSNSHEEWLKRVHPEDVELIGRKEKSYLVGNVERFHYEYRMRHKGGHYIWVQDRGLIIIGDDKKVARLVGVMSDISELKRVENLKSEFISTISYELRTPLTSITASLGLLEAGVFGELPSKALGLVNIASKNSKRLTTLVNDILDMEKLRAGKATFRTDEINLIDLIKHSIELNAEITSAFSVKINFSYATGCRNVIGDKDRLLQVMSNLLSNACKFSPYGEAIEIRLKQQDNFIKVEIEDHGTGIPNDFRHRIFGEFAQADIKDARQHGGTGLGLNITKKLVERMGGEIGYESEFGQGSVFWYTLPLSPSLNFKAGL